MVKRDFHLAKLFAALLTLAPLCAFAVGTDPTVESHDEASLQQAAQRNRGRYVNPNPGQDLQVALAEKFAALINPLKQVMTDTVSRENALKQLILSLGDPANGFAGKIPALNTQDDIDTFFREKLRLERTNFDANKLNGLFKDVLKAQVSALVSTGTTPQDVQNKANAPRLLVGLGNLRGKPNLREIQFYSNGKLDGSKLTKAVDELQAFLSASSAFTPSKSSFTGPERDLIKAEMVSLKDAMNIENGRDPRAPERALNPNGNQVAQGGQPPGGSSSTPGGADSGGSSGGGGSGGGGGGSPGGGGGGGGGRAQQQKLEGGEPQRFEFDQSFASNLANQARKNEINIATGETVGPQDFEQRNIFEAANGITGDVAGYAQQLSSQITGMGPLLAPNAPPIVPPQFASIPSRVNQVTQQGRPITTGGGFGGSFAGAGLGSGGRFNAGAVRPGGTGSTQIPAEFTAAGGTRGGFGSRSLQPKYVGPGGLDRFARENPGQRVIRGNGDQAM